MRRRCIHARGEVSYFEVRGEAKRVKKMEASQLGNQYEAALSTIEGSGKTPALSKGVGVSWESSQRLIVWTTRNRAQHPWRALASVTSGAWASACQRAATARANSVSSETIRTLA